MERLGRYSNGLMKNEQKVGVDVWVTGVDTHQTIMITKDTICQGPKVIKFDLVQIRVTMMKLFNVLLSPIGRVASRPMRNIETSPSKQMYLYLSLVERKEAEFYHYTWLK